MGDNSQTPPRRTREIFISYRSKDSEGYVLSLSQALKAKFGRGKVFLAVTPNTIKGGENFARVIEDKVTSSGVLLAVIGAKWLTTLREKSERADAERDFVRFEIATALARGVPVVPVLLNDAVMPAPAGLPDDLEGLAHLHASTLSTGHWDDDVRRLVERLSELLPPRSRLPLLAVAAAALTLAPAGYFVFKVAPPPPPPPGNANEKRADDKPAPPVAFKRLTALTTGFEPYKVAVSPDGAVVASVGNSNDVGLWRVASGESLAIISGQDGPGRSVVLGDSVVVTGSDDRKIRFWRLGETRPYLTLNDEGYIFSLDLDRGGKTLTSASRDIARDEKTIKVWDVGSGRETFRATVKSPDVIMSVNPARRLAAVNSPAGGIRLLSLDGSGSSRAFGDPPQAEILTATFDRAGDVLAFAFKLGARSVIRVLRVDDGREVAGPTGREGRVVTALAFSPEGRLLTAGYDDGQVQIWDMRNGRPEPALDAHAGKVWGLAFSADGKTFASMGTDKRILLWSVTYE